VFLIVIGCVAGIGAFNMDTSVSSGLGRIHNLGLMDDRRNRLMIAGLLTIVGVIFFVTDKGISQNAGPSVLPSGPDQTPRKFPTDRRLDSDEYQLYLVKTYAIEKNNTLEKYVVNGKLFASVDDALRHAHALDVAAEELVSSARKERQAPIERQHVAVQAARVEKLSPTATAVAVEQNSSEPIAQVPTSLETWIARRKSGEPLAPVLKDLQNALDRGEVTSGQFAVVRQQLLLL